MEELETGILILGSGGAGLFAALHAAAALPRVEIAIAVKGLYGKSGCTRMVQGGYNAVLDPADSFELHLRDTIVGGQFINDQSLAETLVREAPERLRELESVGCFFDRAPDGTIHQKPFAGQSFDRTAHRGDLTGIEIVSRSAERVAALPNVRVLEECRALDLVVDRGDRGIAGAILLDSAAGRFVLCRARAVLLATGGAARLYRYASPSLEKSGDGIAMAYRAGMTLVDMEMLQFHPTGLLAGESVLTGSVVEEGLRGAGGRLYNARGERFMERYDPERLERSTRDVVSRAIYLEVREGRGTPQGGAYLDVRALGPAVLERDFPGMLGRARLIGKDLRRERVEVVPTAHFQMGGVRIGNDCSTEVEGLFVAGEDAGGVHGANRLGGNGVAESIVFGARAGDAMAAWVEVHAQREVSTAAAEERARRPADYLRRDGVESPFALTRHLGDVMWEGVGVIRDERGLNAALDRIRALRERLAGVGAPGGPSDNLAWAAALDLESRLVAAEAIATSALARTESRGAHYRADHPTRDDERWLRNVLLSRGPDGAPRVATQPVALTHLTPAGSVPRDHEELDPPR